MIMSPPFSLNRSTAKSQPATADPQCCSVSGEILRWRENPLTGLKAFVKEGTKGMAI